MSDLEKLCREFIRENEITCGETIYQCDHVCEHSFQFIEKICELVGYHKNEDDA